MQKQVHVQIQGCQGHRENHWAGWKQVGHILNRNNQHKAGVSNEEHYPDLTDQIRQHSFDRSRMLHLDYGSRDLTWWIWDGGDEDEDHGLGQRANGALWQSQHWEHSPSDPETPYKVQWQIWCQLIVQGVGPYQTDWSPLDLHIASSHDSDCSSPFSVGPAYLEEMSTSTWNYSAYSIGATHANAHFHNQAYQQGHQIECVHPNFHQHFIRGKSQRRGEIS